MVKRDSKKLESLLRLGIVLVTIIVVNLLISNQVWQWDLTEEKRYSVSPATESLLRNLDEPVYIEVYLEGDFPAGFKRLQQSVRETLDQFRAYAGTNIQYRFIDPSAVASGGAQAAYYQDLGERGIQPTNLFATENGKKTEKIIFPGAMVSVGAQETPVMLLKGNKSASPDEVLNQSIEGVEYELASAIRKMVKSDRKRIGILYGHGELDTLKMASFTNALLDKYDVLRVNLPNKQRLENYDALVMARPRTTFSEEDRFKLDQFIMRGGKLMAFIDPLHVEMDSVGGEGTIGVPYPLELQDLFFKYGFRLNTNLLQDINAGVFPVVTGMMGDKPQISMTPWPFFPIINSFGAHPISRNLDAVYTRFVASIDTVKATGIKKTPLAFSSKYTRVMSSPVRISFNDLRRDVQQENFNKSHVPVAYLLEGAFTSAFKNRILPENLRDEPFVADGVDNKLLIVADGDFVRNEMNYKTGQPLPLGFDPFTQNQYANEDMVMNAMEYLLDEDGIITARNKEVKIRLLDKVQIENDKVLWQVLNLVLPVLLVIIYGITRHFFRRKKYGRMVVK